MPTLNVTAEQVAQAVTKELRKQRTQRMLPTVPANLQAFSNSTSVHIYNVGPWEHKRGLGSWGDAIIPACPAGQDYIEMSLAGGSACLSGVDKSAIPGDYVEPIPTNEKKFDLEHIEGRFVAEQILGVGRNMSPSASLVRQGVFIGSQLGPGAKPTDQEISDAKDALLKYYAILFNEAEQSVSLGDREATLTIDDRHRMAALALGRNDVSWVKQMNPTRRQDCPACGVPANIGVVLCPNCKYVFDEVRYAEMESRFAQSPQSKRGPGRPPLQA